jgi:predicted dehydrogenase
MKKPINAIIIGAGDRGADVYGNYALRFPEELKIVAVAEPVKERLEIMKKKHNIQSIRCYTTWEEILKEDKIAEVAIITTQDQVHAKPAILAMKRGYDVLLEKPMAVTLEDCRKLVEISEETGRLLQICHVLRYAPFFKQLKEIVDSGRIGKIVNISWRENVSYWHYAHSYVRGNWHNREKASPMILAKSCHDLDLLFWLIDTPIKKISSFGHQNHFGRINQPEGASDRCLDNCLVSEECLYYAPRLYVDLIPLIHAYRKSGKLKENLFSSILLKHPVLTKFSPFKKLKEYSGWPISTISKDLSLDGRMKALKETDYGKCVFAIEEHNVVDHQTVNIEFENGVTANLVMHGFSHEEGRTFRIDGTKGAIIGEFLVSNQKITIHDSYSGTENIALQDNNMEEHGGGDDGIMEVFLKSIRGEEKREFLSTARSALESHLMAFAADISRLENRIVEMSEIR